MIQQSPQEMGRSTFAIFKRFVPLLNQMLFASIVIGLLALAPTFYNMAVYDQIIASGSANGLPVLFLGVSLALGGELLLRLMRNKRLGYFGARLDHVISVSVLERLMLLPPFYTERAALSSQLARLRDFESVREFFTGPLASLFFEMPLVILYMSVVFVIGGTLGLVPLGLIGAYALMLLTMQGRIKASARDAAAAASTRQEFMLETLTKMQDIRLAGLEAVWKKRYHKASLAVANSSFKSAFNAQVVEVSSYVLMTLGGVATLSLGVVKVIDQDITVGALVATMMLIWRIVSPMQLCCASVTRLQQLAASTKQVQRLMAMPVEHDQESVNEPVALKGQITFARVSLRYAADAEPALLGVSFDIKPGQVVAIRGNNGSGKSSLIKLILGLYQPQNGAVRLDGIDVRQFDPMALRQAIAYVPQVMELVPGTVRDNLVLGNPDITEQQCYRALEKAAALEEVMQLPQQMDTVISGEDAETISFMLKQRLNLARAYLKPAKIMLFDEASHSLGKQNDVTFAQMVAELRGTCTIILVTHREDHMRMADKILVLDKGELTHMGQPEQVMTNLRGRRA